MRVIYFILLHCICKIITAEGVSTPECQDSDIGRVCSLHAIVETVSVLDSEILVGSVDALYAFTLGLQSKSQVDLIPNNSTFIDCAGFDFGQLGHKPELCRNFIKVIQLIPNSQRILVCGTNAFRPKCTIHNISDISDYERMTDPDEIDDGFSPYQNNTEIVATLTKNGRFFSGTNFELLAAPQTIKMAPSPLEGDSEFTVQVPVSNRRWLQDPTFVSSYETEDYVYFFLREQAYELAEVENVIYSRVVRICKNDNGTSDISEDNMSRRPFSTFQKARMMCSSRPDSDSLPYTYNNLQSTFIWEEPTGERFLYGVFNSPDNGPSGSAICRFSFDSNMKGSLTNVLDDGAFLVPSSTAPVTWSVTFSNTLTCSDDPRSSSDASMYALAHNPAEDNQPLHTVTGKRLDKIAIDVVLHYKGENQTVIFFSTMTGEIHQLVQGATRRQEVLITNVGRQLGHLAVHKNADETRSLLVTTENQIMLISLGDCSRYSDCFACLDSNDAYCGWDSDKSCCVNKEASDSASVLQSALSTENETVGVCGPRLDSTAPTTITTEQVSTPDSGGVGTRSSMVSVPDLVGATVGAFVVGIPVGAFVCFLLLRFIDPRRKRRKKRSQQVQNGTVIAANNLAQTAPQVNMKKELSIKPNSYVDHTPAASQPDPIPEKKIILDPPPLGSSHKRKNSKDINTMVTPEKSDIVIDEPDHLPPLRSISSASLHSYNRRNGYTYTYPRNGVQRKQVPGYRVPRGRTESTTWLRSNSCSSEPASPFTPTPFTPLDSPISDV